MAKPQSASTIPEDIIPMPPELDDRSGSPLAGAAAELSRARHGNGGAPSLTSAAATELARARWATESEYEDEIREHFSTVPLEEGLSLLAKMRARCELAARTIEARRTAETMNTACCVCGIKKSQMGNRNWRLPISYRDLKTGTWVTDYYCSDPCVVEGNRRKHNISAMSDRGMLPGDDPSRAKNSIMAHQQKVQEEGRLAEAGRKAVTRKDAKRRAADEAASPDGEE